MTELYIQTLAHHEYNQVNPFGETASFIYVHYSQQKQNRKWERTRKQKTMNWTKTETIKVKRKSTIVESK